MGLFQTVVLEMIKDQFLILLTIFNPFITALFIGFSFGPIWYEWGSNTFGYSEVIFQDKIIMFLVITT